MKPAPRAILSAVFALVLLVLAAPEEAAAENRLALRVNDAAGMPGERVAIVLRTYSSRPIGQGQIAVRSRRRASARSNALLDKAAGDESPFAALEEVQVFSTRRDAQFQIQFDPERAVLTIQSPSRTINASDGPLAILYYRLADWVQPGEEYEIGVEVENTALYDERGRLIPVESRPGTLEISSDAEDDEYELKALGAQVRPGKVAFMGVETEVPLALSSGRIVFRYDPSIARLKPKVQTSPRYGNVRFNVNTATPGMVIVNFQSPDRSFNRVPGKIVEILLRVWAGAPRGTSSRVYVDPVLSFLVDADGERVDLETKDGQLVILR
ncbi:MAG TPA: hypothetical protein VMW27_10775 [Thermoanaerobaculia bacterium]|nr:hypothetical protein [Thermoanaerobaculia bacterium]